MSKEKQEFYNNHLSNKYDKVDMIVNDDTFTLDDLRSFLDFQDKCTSSKKGYFKGILDKLSRCGINGILANPDVLGTSKAVEDFGRDGGIVKYIVIETTWADLWVDIKNGRKTTYIRYR
jgi:hypothetical protein